MATFYVLKNGDRKVDYDFRIPQESKRPIIDDIAVRDKELYKVDVYFQDGEHIGEAVLWDDPHQMVIEDQLDYWIANRDHKTPWPPQEEDEVESE